MVLLQSFYGSISSLDWKRGRKAYQNGSQKAHLLAAWSDHQEAALLMDDDDFLRHHGCKKPVGSPNRWEVLSIQDWLSIFDSVLLMSFNQSFCESVSLGRENISSPFFNEAQAHCVHVIQLRLSRCRGERRALCVPVVDRPTRSPQPGMYPTLTSAFNVQFVYVTLTMVNDGDSKSVIVIPALLSNAKHFGHFAWN
jgi:hypothetical protein